MSSGLLIPEIRMANFWGRTLAIMGSGLGLPINLKDAAGSGNSFIAHM
jgi:hypothetical protein